MGGHPAYGRATFVLKKAISCRFGAHDAGTTGTVPVVSGAGNSIGTYIYPYEPATDSGSAVGARGDPVGRPPILIYLLTTLTACYYFLCYVFTTDY